MTNIKIFCTSVKYYKIIDKLPNYIIPLGLGDKIFPPNWIDEKEGKNISHLNPYYGELTGIYFIWKNIIDKMNENDLIGNCHYRKLWLNELYLKKKKTSYNSLSSELLKLENKDFGNFDVIQVQPIIFNKKNLFEDFLQIHETNLLEKSLNFFESGVKNSFSKHLSQNKMYPLNMFITKVKFFKEYCENLFPWLDNCFSYCEQHNLCKGKNIRLPAFLAERFTSFWFSQKERKKYLSYARLGNFFLSNRVNTYINPIKLPLTFRMYPTFHRY